MLPGIMIIFALVLIKNAWMGDDAFITLRTVDNFVNGYGLRWNVVERVQSYTHPLWMFLITPFYFVTREPYFTTLAISFVVSLVTMYLLLYKVARDKNTAFLLGLTMICSKAFVDYAVSGLENPLTYLLIVVFGIVYFQDKRTHKWLLTLSFIASLSMLNRLDTLLLYLPALLYALFQTKHRGKGILYMLVGALPIITWEIFSLLYYGFLFPNTAYAKLSTGVSTGAYIYQGFFYFIDAIKTQPIMIATIVATIYLILRTQGREKIRNLMLMAGMILYLLYILKVGGDFMSGRFFTLPFMLAVVLLAHTYTFKKTHAQIVYGCVAVLLVYTLISPYSVTKNRIDCEDIDRFHEENPFWENYGVLDERAFYFCQNGFLRIFQGVDVPADAMRNIALEDTMFVKVEGAVGMKGYYAGPEFYVVDYHALSNPLLSRLEIVEKRSQSGMVHGWRIGHFYRPLPFGYIETLHSGVNIIQNEQIAEYYDIITLVTQGDIFSPERWKKIFNFHLGSYDALGKFEGGVSLTDIDEISQRNAFQTAFTTQIQRWYYTDTVIVDLKGIQHEKIVYVSLNSYDTYEISYIRDGEELAIMQVANLPNPYNIDGLTSYQFDVPKDVYEGGFDKLRITHIDGPSGYYVGRVCLRDCEVERIK